MEEKLKQTATNCIKIVIFGPESTGKTTLSKQLAAHYQTNWVPEFSRQYALDKLKEGKQLTEEDVLPIAIGQMQLENEIAHKTEKILVCDTNLLETLVYSQTIYNGFSPKELEKSILTHQYHLYILTSIDVPWEKDVVRDVTTNRKEMFLIFEETLKKYNFPHIIVEGNQQKRLQKAITQINKIIPN